jgi:hypothetical protein
MVLDISYVYSQPKICYSIYRCWYGWNKLSCCITFWGKVSTCSYIWEAFTPENILNGRRSWGVNTSHKKHWPGKWQVHFVDRSLGIMAWQQLHLFSGVNLLCASILWPVIGLPGKWQVHFVDRSLGIMTWQQLHLFIGDRVNLQCVSILWPVIGL